MLKNLLLTVALLLAVSPVLAMEGNADDLLLKGIKGFDLLTSSQKANAIEVMKSENCYYECSDTIFKCLSSGNNRAARRLAAFVVRRALTGLPVKELKEDVQKRAASAFPPVEHKSKLDGLIPYGDKNAPVKAVIYADFECPYCGIASPSLKRLVDQLSGKLVMYFKNFPIISHEHGVECARALLAAGRQGKFWQMHDKLFANVPNFKPEQLDAYMQQLGMDVNRAHADMKSQDLTDEIRAQKEEGMAFGMTGTPGIFINNKFYRGDKGGVELLDRIEEELEIIEGGE